MKVLIGYHFTSNTLRDGQPLPEPGKILRHKGLIIPCKSGLHMSEHPFDALCYAPGPILHKVKLRGKMLPHGDPIDKWVGRERIILASFDATGLLWAFARQRALSVAHLWDCPDIVLRYLKTGDESLRAAAGDAAWAAAWDAAWAAAGDAARAAARAAVGAAAGAAAWAAARDVAGAAAWAAARDAARAAAREQFKNLVEAEFHK